MNTVIHTAPGYRRVPGWLAAGVAVMIAIGAMSLTVVPKAHAESGRRICEYSFMAKPRDYSDPLIRISLGMDYKKDGRCPALDPQLLASTGLVDVDQVFPNPVPKWTCEDWGRQLNLYQTNLGADPCPNMWNDYVYAIMWQDPTTPNAPKPDYLLIGHWNLWAL